MRSNSPWLEFERPSWPALKNNAQAEIVILGAGISGVATLYFLLKNTDKNIILLEQNQVASGATGHNAGLAVSYIEKPTSELIAEFGEDLTRQAFAEVNHGMTLIKNILQQMKITDNLVPFHSAVFGIDSLAALIKTVQQEDLRAQWAHARWHYLVCDDPEIKNKIPSHLLKYIEFTAHDKILAALNIQDKRFIAASMSTKYLLSARINSAKFCYQMLNDLTRNFAGRFSVFENTYISAIDIHENQHILRHQHGEVRAEQLILCTNGYKNFSINIAAKNSQFNKIANNVIPYQADLGAWVTTEKQVIARAFLNSQQKFSHTPYFYISNGPVPCQLATSLTIVGGPEYQLSEVNRSKEVILEFLQQTLRMTPTHFDYYWGGVMGYTQNKLRWVGRDPDYSHLWYNLGCNGVGVLHAVSGAEKIARMMKGEQCGRSVFDPC